MSHPANPAMIAASAFGFSPNRGAAMDAIPVSNSRFASFHY